MLIFLQLQVLVTLKDNLTLVFVLFFFLSKLFLKVLKTQFNNQ